jgi:hypothetical protein
MSRTIDVRKILQYFIPSISQIGFLIVFITCFTVSGSFLLGDGDTGYHIRAGEIILKDLAVPRHDPFSFITPPLPWTAHEWLSEVVMAIVHNALGLPGIVFLFALLLSTTYWLLFRWIRSGGRNILVDLLILALVLLSSRIHWHARPHVFSLLLVVLLYQILILHREDRGNYLYVIPPMMLLWVNLHGGFIAGFLFMGIFLSGYFLRFLASNGEERSLSANKGKQLSLACVASVLAACVNPFGVHAFLFPFRLVSETYLMDHVQEFLSPNFHGFAPYRYLILFLIGMLGLSKTRLSITELALVLLFTSMSLYSMRYIPLCAIVYAPILSRHGDILIQESKARCARLLKERSGVYGKIDASAKGYAIPLAVLVVFAGLAAGKIPVRFTETMAPTAAIDFLRANPVQGNMFNNDEIGDYVIYWLYPRYKVFVDGRLDMYGEPIIKEYFKVTAIEQGWKNVLDKHDINYIFFYTDTVLVRHLLTDSGWRGIYSDNVASIFLRNTPENAETIARYAPSGTVPGKGH